MRDRKKTLIFFGFLIFSTSFSSCRLSQVLPVLKVPDGNKDRMEKKTFSGTETNPKYWISKVTVVDTSFGLDGLGFVFEGLQSETKVGYFEFKRDKLKFNNAVTRQFLEEPDVVSQGVPELINEWDIEHSQFRRAEVDGYPTNREEENDWIPWYEKNYFTIDWNNANISEANTFPHISYAEKNCWSKKTAYVIDTSREITEDYISFVVAVEYEQMPSCSKNLKRWNQNNFVTTVHYKYSFKTVKDPRLPDESYSPYRYDGEQDPLLKKYGYFRTIRPVIADDNRDKNIFYMNRWNPNKKHILYFSQDYPEEYKDIAHGVICHTNKIFAKYGLSDYPLDGKCREDGSVLPSKKETCTKGICFELRENSGQELGDIRYSFFHSLKVNIPVSGYGPSDVHPATGEIIGGNVIISTYLLDFYLKYLLQPYYKRDLEKYYNEEGDLIENRKTKYEDSSLFVKMKQTLNQNDHKLWTDSSKLIGGYSKIRPVFEYIVSEQTFGHPYGSRFTKSNEKYHSLLFDEKFLSESMTENVAKESKEIIGKFQENLEKQFSHERNTTIYPAEPLIAQLPDMFANGMKPEEIKRRILFRLMTHEFGHVLNLRHNFYGSLDVRHWHKKESDGSLLKTSSIMDYLNLKDQADSPLRSLFGPYDISALVYAYSGGKRDLSKEKNTQYMFCTDHHKFLNFLCNAWDRGTTPSEVMMSLIESYEESYFIWNFRLNRAYWNASYYPVRMFITMWDLKRALMMWRTAFNDSEISEELDKSKLVYTKEEKNFISNQIQKDIRQAIKLNMAFYNSVLQLSSADRDWKNRTHEESGSAEKIGIFWDKVFAMLFLMGDEGFMYNPNHSLSKASYLTYMNQLGFREMIDKIMENTLTLRVDMQPWFIGFGRFLYAKNASNYHNIASQGALLEKIAVRCYTPKGLKSRFGIDPYSYRVDENSPPDFLDTAVVPMESYLDKITDTYYFGTNEDLGITFFDGDYYVASSNLNKYSFTIIDNMKRISHAQGDSLRLAKQDVHDMFLLYNRFKKRVIPQSCDNGD